MKPSSAASRRTCTSTSANGRSKGLAVLASGSSWDRRAVLRRTTEPHQGQPYSERSARRVAPGNPRDGRAGRYALYHALKSYLGLGAAYDHQTIDYAIAFVDGNIHTNSVENF